MLRPRRSMMRARSRDSLLPLRGRCAASIAAQRTSRDPCLVIRPRCTVVSDTDLGHEHRRERRPDPADLLDHPVTDVVGEPAGHGPAENVDLPVVCADQANE
jgi:hypothetical protein